MKGSKERRMEERQTRKEVKRGRVRRREQGRVGGRECSIF